MWKVVKHHQSFMPFLNRNYNLQQFQRMCAKWFCLWQRNRLSIRWRREIMLWLGVSTREVHTHLKIYLPKILNKLTIFQSSWRLWSSNRTNLRYMAHKMLPKTPFTDWRRCGWIMRWTWLSSKQTFLSTDFQ